MSEESIPQVGELSELLDELETSVRDAKPIPLSSSVRVEREGVLELIGSIRAVLPEELRGQMDDPGARNLHCSDERACQVDRRQRPGQGCRDGE